MSSVDIIKSPIKEELKQFEQFFSSTMKSDVSLLNLVTKYVLKRKGKKMRPMVVFLTDNLYNEALTVETI